MVSLSSKQRNHIILSGAEFSSISIVLPFFDLGTIALWRVATKLLTYGRGDFDLFPPYIHFDSFLKIVQE